MCYTHTTATFFRGLPVLKGLRLNHFWLYRMYSRITYVERNIYNTFSTTLKLKRLREWSTAVKPLQHSSFCGFVLAWSTRHFNVSPARHGSLLLLLPIALVVDLQVQSCVQQRMYSSRRKTSRQGVMSQLPSQQNPVAHCSYTRRLVDAIVNN